MICPNRPYTEYKIMIKKYPNLQQTNRDKKVTVHSIQDNAKGEATGVLCPGDKIKNSKDYINIT